MKNGDPVSKLQQNDCLVTTPKSSREADILIDQEIYYKPDPTSTPKIDNPGNRDDIHDNNQDHNRNDGEFPESEVPENLQQKTDEYSPVALIEDSSTNQPLHDDKTTPKYIDQSSSAQADASDFDT